MSNLFLKRRHCLVITSPPRAHRAVGGGASGGPHALGLLAAADAAAGAPRDARRAVLADWRGALRCREARVVREATEGGRPLQKDTCRRIHSLGFRGGEGGSCRWDRQEIGVRLDSNITLAADFGASGARSSRLAAAVDVD